MPVAQIGKGYKLRFFNIKIIINERGKVNTKIREIAQSRCHFAERSTLLRRIV